MLWHKREFPSGWLHPSLSWRRYITSHTSSQEGCACRKDILPHLEVNMGTRQMKGKPGGSNVVGKALVMVWFPETASFQFHIPIKIEVYSNGKIHRLLKLLFFTTNMQVYY